MNNLTRREFLKASGTVAAGVGLSVLSGAKKAEAAGPYPMSYSQKLPQVVLGRTGVSVSRLGLGGACWIKDGTDADDPYVANAIHNALDNGISYLDTANNYNRSQLRIGLVMATRRSEAFLATKFEAGLANRTYDIIMPEVENSLLALQTSYIDLLQVHMVNNNDNLAAFGQTNGAYWTLCKLRDEGVIRFMGMTGHPDSANVKTALTMYDWDCFLGFANGLNSSLPYWTDQVPMCRSKNIGVIGMKPLGGGYPSVTVGYGMGQVDYQSMIRYALSVPRGQTVDVIVPGVANYYQVGQLANVVKNFVPMTEYECGQMERRLNQTYMWITDAKRRPDSVGVTINDENNAGVVVTAVFSDCFYAESFDRTGGMKFKLTGTLTMPVLKSRQRIVGMITTDTNGERYVSITSRTQVSTNATVNPVALSNAALGGADYARGSVNGQGQIGVLGGSGLNNVGMLVKTVGRVVESGAGYFIIDDGCGVPSGGAVKGVRVDSGTITRPALNKFVAVTGISTLYFVDPDYFRCVRVRSSTDIQTLA